MQQSSVHVNSKFTFLADEYEAAKLRWAGGAESPNWRGNEPKKTGARSARARTRGQNPLVITIGLVGGVIYDTYYSSNSLASLFIKIPAKRVELQF